jgi:hypothetical protein
VRIHLALAALTLVAATAHAEAPKVRRLADEPFHRISPRPFL